MKLSDLKIDAIKVEQGAWVDSIPDLGDIRLKVRGMGNADFRRMQSALARALPRQKRDDVAEQDRILNKLLVETVLLDWDGLIGDDGAAVPYSKDMATTLVTDPALRAFRDGVVFAASVVAERTASETETSAKN